MMRSIAKMCELFLFSAGIFVLSAIYPASITRYRRPAPAAGWHFPLVHTCPWRSMRGRAGEKHSKSFAFFSSSR